MIPGTITTKSRLYGFPGLNLELPIRTLHHLYSAVTPSSQPECRRQI